MPSQIPIIPAVSPQNEGSTKTATSARGCADKIWCTYLMSVCAASVAEFVTYPLDLTKTRLQIQGELAKKEGKPVPYRGMFKTASGIVNEEGFLALWRGIQPAVARHVVYSGCRIVIYDSLRNDVFKKKENEIFPLWKSALCGMTSGMISQWLSSPTDLVKVQVQMEGRRRLLGEPPRVKGAWDAFTKVLKSGGVRGLWKGSVPNMQRAALVNLGDLTTYDMAKQYIKKYTSLEERWPLHTLSSFSAGFVAAGLGTPADVIKTRVMNQPVDERGRGIYYSSSWDCLKQTIKGEGLPALYKGFLPVWIRMAPWSLTFWLTFENFKTVLSPVDEA